MVSLLITVIFETDALKLLPGAMGHILALVGASGAPAAGQKLDGKKRFLDVMAAISKAYTLCSTIDEAEPLKEGNCFSGSSKKCHQQIHQH